MALSWVKRKALQRDHLMDLLINLMEMMKDPKSGKSSCYSELWVDLNSKKLLDLQLASSLGLRSALKLETMLKQILLGNLWEILLDFQFAASLEILLGLK